MTKDDYAWAAGFIDGEGNFAYNKGRGSIMLLISQKDPERLYELQRILGGRVLGPYLRTTKVNHLESWINRYRLSQRDLVKQIDFLWPRLGPVKRNQYLRACELRDTGKSSRVQVRAKKSLGTF